MKLRMTREEFVRRRWRNWQDRERVYDYLAERRGSARVTLEEIWRLFPHDPDKPLVDRIPTFKRWIKQLLD